MKRLFAVITLSLVLASGMAACSGTAGSSVSSTVSKAGSAISSTASRIGSDVEDALDPDSSAGSRPESAVESDMDSSGSMEK